MSLTSRIKIEDYAADQPVKWLSGGPGIVWAPTSQLPEDGQQVIALGYNGLKPGSGYCHFWVESGPFRLRANHDDFYGAYKAGDPILRDTDEPWDKYSWWAPVNDPENRT